MRVHGSRTHLGAFLPFRDARGGRFDFFARFSTRAEAPLSLDAADASAGMVSRSAALSPRKISTPSWIYPTLRYDPRGVRSDAETLTLRACDRRVTPTSARAPRSSTVPSKSAEVSTQDREKVISRPSTTQVDDDKTSFSSPARNEARVFCRPTIFPRPATTPRTRHVSSCAPRVVRASAVERFGSPEGSRDPRVLGRRVSSRNRKASFKRDAHAPWRRLTGPPWGHQASAPPRRRTARR